jgi:hypothetical protein
MAPFPAIVEIMYVPATMTYKGPGPLVPAGVVTVTLRLPGAAFDATVILTVRTVGLVEFVTLLMVTPLPDTAAVVWPKVKLVPVKLKLNVDP